MGVGVNTTDPLAATVHGTNPQNLLEKITRLKIYATLYWKEFCFGLTAEALVERACELTSFGGVYGGNSKPSRFLCLVLKMLQLQPEKEIVVEFLKNEEFKYVRVLGAFYLRLVGKPVDVYKYLELLYNDFRKIRCRTRTGWEVVRVDEFIDELLTKDYACDIALPHLPKRWTLEDLKLLPPRRSLAELDEGDSDEEEEEATKSPPPPPPPHSEADMEAGELREPRDALATSDSVAAASSGRGGRDRFHPRRSRSDSRDRKSRRGPRYSRSRSPIRDRSNDRDWGRGRYDDRDRDRGRYDDRDRDRDRGRFDDRDRYRGRYDDRDRHRDRGRYDDRDRDRGRYDDRDRDRGRFDDRDRHRGRYDDRDRDRDLDCYDDRSRDRDRRRHRSRSRDCEDERPSRKEKKKEKKEKKEKKRKKAREASLFKKNDDERSAEEHAPHGTTPAENSVEYWNLEREKLGLKPLRP